ncbi:hypothetical protein D3C72_1592710 [compost metagenome]
MRTANGLRACLRQAEVLDLAFANQVLHHPGDVLDRYVRIDAVLVKQIDVIGLQSTQRALDRNPDVLGAAVKNLLLIVVAKGEAKLGGDDHLIAHRCQGFAHHLFVQVRAVHLGGIEERDASVNRRSDQRNGLLCVSRGAVAMAQAHATQAQG